MWGTFVRGFVDLEPASSCEHMSEINSMRQLSHCIRNSGDNKHSKGMRKRDREKERGSEKNLMINRLFNLRLTLTLRFLDNTLVEETTCMIIKTSTLSIKQEIHHRLPTL